MLVTRESAFVWASLAFLAGLIFGLASCSPECAPRQVAPTVAVQ